MFSCAARAFARRSSNVGSSSSSGFLPQPGNVDPFASSLGFFPKNDVMVACFVGFEVFFLGILGASTSMTSTGLPVGFDADAFWRFGAWSGGPFSFFGRGALRFFAGSSCEAPVAALTRATCRAWSLVRSCVGDR